MGERYRLFYYFLLGASGGLTGWFLQAVAYRGIQSQALNVLAFRGAFIGSLIGLAIAAYEGLASRSLSRLIKFSFYGFLLGVAAGAIALPLAGRTYCLLLGDCETSSTAKPSIAVAILIGVFCWALFGGIIGLIESIGKGTQVYKGFLGGLLGGVVGGLIYEVARVQQLTVDSLKSQALVALSLTLLGGFIGLAIALIATFLSEASIRVLDGKMIGRVYDVTRFVTRSSKRQLRGIIGSDKTRAHIFIRGGKEILPQHAFLTNSNQTPTLVASPDAIKARATTLVNGRAITKCPLNNGDTIKIGNTQLRYQQVRKKKRQ